MASCSSLRQYAHALLAWLRHVMLCRLLRTVEDGYSHFALGRALVKISSKGKVSLVS